MPKNEKGVTMLEEIMAVALIALALTVFVTGLSVASSGVGTVHKRVSSENLARAGLEHVKNAPFAESYDDVIEGVPIPVPGYSLTVEAATIPSHAGLQLITVTVWSGSEVAFAMEEYKRDP